MATDANIGGVRLRLTGDLVAQVALRFDLQFEPSAIIQAKKLDKLAVDIKSFREPLKRSVQRVMAPSFQANFDAGGRPKPWRPHSEVTTAKKHRGQKLMVRTGKLRKTMGQLNIWTFTPESAVIRDLPQSVWYGKVHQQGAEYRYLVDNPASIGLHGAPEGKSYEFTTIPRRRFIMMHDRDEAEITRIFSDWLDERVARVGL